jgi:UDP-N-acetylglucosamine 4-epimerase
MSNRIENSNVLVTGGAGFIGSNLCEDLLNYNNHVICLDNFATGKHENLSSFKDHPNFTLIEGDIRNFQDCTKAVAGSELVLHQAALGSVPRSLNDPQTTNDVNITGFLNMLLAARNAGVKRFIYAASSSTYGDSQELPKVEQNIGMPLSPYAVTKYVNELYAHVFGLNYGLECIGLRYFNVYGRRQSPDGAYAAVIPKFVHLLRNGQSPTINGTGDNSRDFTYIDNVIQMNHLAGTTTNLQAVGQVFNTAVGERATLLQLTTLLKKYLSEFQPEIADIEVLHGPERQGDIPHSLASIEKARKLLGYIPTHNLEKGLMETIEYIMKEM